MAWAAAFLGSCKITTTVWLLKQLLTIGFEVTAAVKIVNASFLLSRFREAFFTVDIVFIDIYPGDGEFILIESFASYIK